MLLQTHDPQYASALASIWDNLVNRKYYLTGGVGSGATSEGFGGDYALPNASYCESCSSCGELFFQEKMNLASRDARYADLYEDTIYNAILGDIDLQAKNYTYTNPLDQAFVRYLWHKCPCCVGNIPKTLLMMPSWMYARGDDGLYVNLYVGSTMTLPNIGGGSVQVVQTTNYPWDGKVTIRVSPQEQSRFGLHLRIPDRQVSELYVNDPPCSGYLSLQVNGQAVTPKMDRGYAVIDRTWKSGDTVELVLPMVVQRVHAKPQVVADNGRVALRYGPLAYNFESADQDLNDTMAKSAALWTRWEGQRLGGIMTINGKFADGAAMTAVPNYARNNRGGRSVVWMAEAP